MENDDLHQLLIQYFNNTISRNDCEKLLKYLDDEDFSVISAAIEEVQEQGKPTVVFDASQQENIYNQLIANIRLQQEEEKIIPLRSTNYFGSWIRIAAILAVVLSVGFLLYQNFYNTPGLKVVQKKEDILLPDQNQAILTLADGRTITLSDTLDSALALESGIKIIKNKDGSIVYDTKQQAISKSGNKYNTFSTPKGYSCQILLPDGTKVWLNTASSIRYPVVFSANERRISLTGEAYFEVAHHASKPFNVEANGSIIKVLGTHFNVSAFEDEDEVITTLLEGSVNVSKSNRHVILRPGEQALVNRKTGDISQSQVDVSAVMAWKNGYFQFHNESIESIINKISRWYDIESIEYRGQFNDRFTGTFQRSKEVSHLFNHLEKLSPYKIEIKERRVIIMK